MSRFPFGYPRGWFQILWSCELKPLEAKVSRAFGKDWIVWRDGTSEVHVSESYCPHMGAFLGESAVVTPNGLKCPFHGWTFNGSGQVADIPYATRRPSGRLLAGLPTIEANGHILVWHDPEHSYPDWSIPTLPAAIETEYGDYFRRDLFSVRSACQELSENLIDRQHIPSLHGLSTISDLSVIDSGPRRTISLIESVQTPLGQTEIRSDITCFGLGYIVTWFRRAIDICAVSSVTPVDEEHVDVRFSWLARRSDGNIIRKRVVNAVAAAALKVFREDISIWEKKAYLERPLLIAEDGPIREFRGWAKQFYPS